MDTHTFAGPLPVVLIDSPILYSLVMYIHCKKIPHVGVERTVKEVFKEIMVPNGLRKMIRKIKADCTTCRLFGLNLHSFAGSGAGSISSLG